MYNKIRFSKRGKKLYIRTGIIAFIIIATFYVPLLIWAGAHYEESAPGFKSLYQQNEEWEIKPFVDIVIVSGDSPSGCSSWFPGYEDMFTRTVKLNGKKFNLARFGDKLICGKRGGSNYLKAQQPDPDSGICPGVLIPCSN